MISGGVITPPAIQKDVVPTCCLYYGLLDHTNLNGRGLPVSILWESLSGKWREFLIQLVRIISGFMLFSSWGHASHWRLLPSVLISFSCRRQCILLECFYNRLVLFLGLKATDQACHLYWGFPPIMPTNFLGWQLPLDGCTINLIVLIIFSASTATFMNMQSLWLPCGWFQLAALGEPGPLLIPITI